ncbi:DNA polymerase III subunit alpha [Oceanidesulfovibrio marinus]|uniref:DNA polymerase III subunit alpha n=1 Tax=Oceanidesulfovibrio marinus TaxID=370038 RepID=A0A6M4XA19_9BACT|nr:DNA polymerase III subunit alpha [Oceanidesulfovibrio marinus]QJT08832.1 DNA polymerase III subunit alpha [Oceanidesulfovibrio marinus]TVM36740.1 DNA polymerase III subunit alpha [Oceanidesulfovibrio marinus]
MPDFVHLHCHTEYSLLDGAIRLKDLISRAKEFGCPAAAITDHGNLYGALSFYMKAKAEGIKPILGSELYVAHHNHQDRESTEAKRRYHLVLLAQNEVGWRNLVKLVSTGYLKGFYHKPRVDKELLRQHSEGIIALSACLAGEIPRKLMNDGVEAAIPLAQEYADIFPGRFYLELQANNLPEQAELNEKVIALSRQTNLPLVATNDCHYLAASDYEAHDVLLCIQTAACVNDEKRMRFTTSDLYYKSPEEMAAHFPELPEAIANTALIAEQCDVELDLKSHHFPVYSLPEGKSLHEEFVDLCRRGLEERIAKAPYEVDRQVYDERLEKEIGVIAEMGFEGYFLIVQDFINWAKGQNIPVGPGRGSAAGSLVAWALRITNLDPIPYNLLFERFLNIERVSMPDIDVDFCERRRGEVIKYVTEKYGDDSVAQITTFGTMKAKAVVRDVGRALGMSFGETDRIAKLIPEDLKMTIDKALEQEPELKILAEEDPTIGQLIDVSRRLEGLSRHASTHAAGVVIGDKQLDHYLPLYRGKKDEVVTQFDMKMVEKVGLIKFDFLGLRTMTVVQDALELIGRQGKEVPDLDTMILDDEETYQLYSRGDTDGVFQVESSGMRKYLRMLKPSCFDDLIAMLALYRPGPLNSGMVDEFIKRKHGEVPVTYPVPQLQDTLESTYGVIVYQEQVMKIAQVVANYTLGGADLLRRAMGKKNAAAMAEERVKFVAGAAENNIGEKKANEIFDLMEKFAEYGFNKSHSAAYALISYYTAYLKTYYKAEFMAALMTSELSNQDKLLKYINACRDMGIPVVPPNVNVGRREFNVSEGEVVYGLGGVKNVGDEAINEIVREREENGPYISLLDLACRINLRKVTKRVFEHLIKAGACDCLGATRQGLLASLDQVVARAQKRAKDKESGQTSLFAMVPESEAPVTPGVGFDCPEQGMEEWEDELRSGFEKDALGFYLTAHPLLPYRRELPRLGLETLETCADKAPKQPVRTAILITSKKEYITKKGDKMAFLGIEDLTGQGEAAIFPESYRTYKEFINADKPLIIEGTVSDRSGPEEEEGPKQAKLLINSCMFLAEAAQECTEPVTFDLRAEQLTGEGLAAFKALVSRHSGPAEVNLRVHYPDACCLLKLGASYRVSPCPELEKAIQRLECRALDPCELNGRAQASASHSAEASHA